MAIIYLFGDSITYGAWDIEKGGWAARLRNYLDEIQLKDDSKYYLCYNLGIPGETTDGFVKRFATEFQARAKEDKNEETIFVFAYGANDMAYIVADQSFRVPEDRFVTNMNKVLDEAQKISPKIIVLNIPPEDEEICKKNYGHRKIRLNSNVEKYNALISQIGAQKSVQVVDVYGEYTKGDFHALLSVDGLHPNEKGHELIFQKVKDALVPLL